MKQLILAVDFDGTIIKNDFPHIHEEMPYSIDVINALKKAGHRLILWTCREDGNWQGEQKNYLTEAVDWCKEKGIEFDAINTTITNEDWRDEHTLKRKPNADYYIDDRNIGGFLGWDKIGRILLGDEEMDKIIAKNTPQDQSLGLQGIESQYKSWGDAE